MYVCIKRKIFNSAVDCPQLKKKKIISFSPCSASWKVNAGPSVRIINECGQSCACSAEFCIIAFIFTSEIHFSCCVTLIVMPHLGGGHSSVLSTHARTKCATEIVLISAGNAFLLWSAGSGVIKRETFIVWYCSRWDFFKCNQKGRCEAVI